MIREPNRWLKYHSCTELPMKWPQPDATFDLLLSRQVDHHYPPVYQHDQMWNVLVNMVNMSIKNCIFHAHFMKKRVSQNLLLNELLRVENTNMTNSLISFIVFSFLVRFISVTITTEISTRIIWMTLTVVHLCVRCAFRPRYNNVNCTYVC